MAWSYLLECSDGSLYAGWTTDVERRVRTHNAGTGARYTRSRLPVRLVHAREWPDRSSAMRDEARMKRLTRAAKLELVASHDEGGPGERRGA